MTLDDAAIELVTSIVHVVELEFFLRHNAFTPENMYSASNA